MNRRDNPGRGTGDGPTMVSSVSAVDGAMFRAQFSAATPKTISRGREAEQSIHSQWWIIGDGRGE